MIENLPHRSIGFHYSRSFSILSTQSIGLVWLEGVHNCYDFNVNSQESCLFLLGIEGKALLTCGKKQYVLVKNKFLLLDLKKIARIQLYDSFSAEFVYLEMSASACKFLEDLNLPSREFFTFNPNDLNMTLDIYQSALEHRMSTIFTNSKITSTFFMDLISGTVAASQRLDPLGYLELSRKFIRENFRDSGLNLDRIANHTGISKYHLCKEFKSHFRLTPGQYLKEVRLEEAKKLLKEKNDFSIQEISKKTGYASSGYFGKVFKKETGLSPEEYRRKSARFDIVETIR